ncbi:MAG: hypothetical protein CMC00_04725 [Flavobacteriaceae bacterium]|nr:hypothetical protein [Flavobacteriaceae bacterium]
MQIINVNYLIKFLNQLSILVSEEHNKMNIITMTCAQGYAESIEIKLFQTLQIVYDRQNM